MAPALTFNSEKLIPISRRIAFLDPLRSEVTLSYDGQWIAWLETHGDERNVMVAEANNIGTARKVTSAQACEILPFLAWVPSGRHLIVFRDCDGDENYRAFSIELATGMICPLTPEGRVRALFHRASMACPSKLLFAVNSQDNLYFDLVRIDVATAEAVTIFVNPGFCRLHAGADFEPRIAEQVSEDGEVELLVCEPNGAWRPFTTIPFEDTLTTHVERISADGHVLFLIDSRGRDRAVLIEINLVTGTETVLAADLEADIDTVVFDPMTDRPLAASATATRRRWYATDPRFAPTLDLLLRDAGTAELTIEGVTPGGASVLARIEHSDAAAEYRIVAHRLPSPVSLFRSRDDLEGIALQVMQPVTIRSRDGLALQGYLTLPPGPRRSSLPLMLTVHGGPYDRDYWCFSPLHQWLAGRGYAVLAINFRGSTGFGKVFVTAADHEWGGRMQDDLVDAVDWAVSRGIADPMRVGVYGASYGGYAALMAAARDSDRFACFVDIGGPSDLVSFMTAIPIYWRSWFAMIRRRLADPQTAAGQSWLAARSPITHIARITHPLLIAQGLQDVRVRPIQSRSIATELAGRGSPVTLVILPNEGHFIQREETRIALAAVVELFLAHHLGGAFEPFGRDLFAAGLHIEIGGDFLPSEIRASLMMPELS